MQRFETLKKSTHDFSGKKVVSVDRAAVTDGYDGHCMRAYAYFKDQMPDIEDTIESINSIKGKYEKLRSLSKNPTFALTYQGTYITLMKNCGFDEAMAKQIENNYHKLYKVSDEWVQAHLDEAAKCGYVVGAFGLKVRTPLLSQVVRGTSRTPFEAEAEGRTAGNALGQSWCMLTNRASAEFLGVARKSKYRLDIRPFAHIHDAQYMMVRDDVAIVEYVNNKLVDAVRWQDDPLIAHDEVKLGGNLGIFYPNWSNEIELKNYISQDEIKATIEKGLAKLAK